MYAIGGTEGDRFRCERPEGRRPPHGLPNRVDKPIRDRTGGRDPADQRADKKTQDRPATGEPHPEAGHGVFAPLGLFQPGVGVPENVVVAGEDDVGQPVEAFDRRAGLVPVVGVTGTGGGIEEVTRHHGV